MRIPPGCSISVRARASLRKPELFARYVLGRAATAGFTVSPGAVSEVAAALRAVTPEPVDPDTAYRLYRDVFRAFLAQDPDQAQRFDRFWDELWFVCSQNVVSGSGKTLADVVGRELAKRVADALSGQISIPVEVLVK